MQRTTALVRRLVGDERGGIAILFGISALVLFGLAGVAIDSSRAYHVSFKLQDGLDAAALAAAKLHDDPAATEADFQRVGEAYLQSYIQRLGVNDVAISNIVVTPNRADWSVTVKADVAVKTLFGAVSAGVNSFDFTPSSTVVFKPKRIELALVLDITGSMCDVPPALPADACASGAKINALKVAATDIVEALAATAPSRNSIKVSLIPYSASVNLGGRASGLTGGASVDGCLVERTGGAAYRDASPSSFFEVANLATYPAYSCVQSEVLGLTDISEQATRQPLLDRINALRGHGGTAGHLGLAWGWYSVSPEWSGFWPGASAPRPFEPDRVMKAVILMTDGMFNTSYYNGGETVAWPNPSSANAAIPGTSGNQALRLCQEMRESDKQIAIYTVGFQTPVEAEALLKQCSGEANYYNADNATQLSAAFKAIAKRLTSMRVTS
ncbi:MAG: pilus assembly protein TadG-related protein [Hyphomicrobiaceae bacterium]